MPPGYQGFKRKKKAISKKTKAKDRFPPGFVSAQDLEIQEQESTSTVGNGVVDVDEEPLAQTEPVSDGDAEASQSSMNARPRRKGSDTVVYAGLDEDAPTASDDDEGNESDGSRALPNTKRGAHEGEDDSEEESVARSGPRASAYREAQKAMDEEQDADDTHADDELTSMALDQNTSIVELSLTLSKLKGHVNPAWATLLHQWMHARDACLAGAVALERGGKQQNLHVQGILRMRMDPNDIEKLKNELKALIGWKRGDGSGTHMTLKQFVLAQVSEYSQIQYLLCAVLSILSVHAAIICARFAGIYLCARRNNLQFQSQWCCCTLP